MRRKIRRVARFFQAFDCVGVDFRVAAVERADEKFRIFQRTGCAEKVDDEVDDRLIAGEKRALEHFEIVERMLFLDRVAEIEIKIGPFDFDVEDVDEIGLELGQREAA